MEIIMPRVTLTYAKFENIMYTSCSGCRDVGHENVNILQHLQSDRRSGASTQLFLNLPVQFYYRTCRRLSSVSVVCNTAGGSVSVGAESDTA